MNTTFETRKVPLANIFERDGLNCRKSLQDVTELAASIAEVGLLYPPLIVQAEDRPPIFEQDPCYYIIHGHRRVKAMRSLNWTESTFFVAPPQFPLNEQYLINLAENGRENLTPAELADRCVQIADSAARNGRKMTSEELGKRIGFSASYVRNLMRLRRDLHPDLWAMMERCGHRAPVSHLLDVLKYPDYEQIDVWKHRHAEIIKSTEGLDTAPPGPKKRSWRTIAAELVKQAPPDRAAGARWLLEELVARLGRAEIERALA
jgi:ParB/RepB/Spo0J family partition protein